MDNPLFLSYDGDGCGKKVGRAVIANDEDKLREVSAKIDLGHEIVKHWAIGQGGKIISGGGDEGCFKLPKSSAGRIEQLRKDYHFATGITISVGVGSSLSEAGRSLLAAKFRGKDQIAYYDETVEKDIRNARQKVKKGKASQEEYKLSEAYLEKAEGNNMANENSESVDCQYCNQTDGIDSQHCKYCHDAEAAEGAESCPFCKENEEQGSEGCPFCEKSPIDAEDCPYCKDDAASGQKQPEVAEQDNHAAEQKEHIGSPDSTNESAAAGSEAEKAQANAMGMNPPIIGKPEMGDNSPVGIGSANPSDAGAPSGSPQGEGNEEGKEGIPEEGAHSEEALQAIAQKIEGQNPEGDPEKEEAKQIDDADVAAAGVNMEGSTSRPPGYEENTPADMGTGGEGSEENPELSSVLQEGLDSHANDAQRENVIQMVSHALQGFKASKDILENAREQAPGLYDASIAMLKAMIEMAKMLGLQSSGVEGQQIVKEPKEENEWHDPFPTHPDKGGEAKPGHAAAPGDAAQAPKGNSPIGQPIGKLPTKSTTQHVARTTIPVGGVNPKGQKKVMDPKTGKVRFIDMKQGRVMGASGVPIKPPKQGENEPKN